MPKVEHIELLRQGKSTWNAWRKANPGILPRLRSARLDGQDLSGFDLHDAYLRKAHLKGACLNKCKLREANLSGANLEGASLIDAEMSGAKLRVAHLHGADLSNADLKSAILVNTDLRDARLSHAHIYGISAWEVRLDGAEQQDLVVTHPGQPVITTDDLLGKKPTLNLVWRLILIRSMKKVLGQALHHDSRIRYSRCPAFRCKYGAGNPL